jgi:hypothetical protein
MAEPLETPAGPDRAVVLAEVRMLFLDRLASLGQRAGIFSSTALDAVRRGSGQFFDDMTSARGRGGFDVASGLTASKIGLVDDHQLELSIRLGEFARQLEEECSGPLFKLYQRFVTLLDRPGLAGADNPVAPEGVGHGLAEMFAELGDSHERALARLAEIKTLLVSEMPVLYAELNELMVRHHVRAAKTVSQPGEGRSVERRKGGRRAGDRIAADPMASLQQAALSRLAPGSGQAAGGAGAGMPTTSMAAGSGGDGGFAPAAAAYDAAVFDQFMARLTQWQRQDQADLFGSGAAGAGKALQALKAGELAPMLRAHEAAALDVLAALFDVLFDDPQLADAVKAAMARLQIPLLKAAVLDPSFFSDRAHPARVLLDIMAQAAAGLGPGVDGEHPVCAELRRVAAAVQSEFERDLQVFSEHAAELETFMARHNHDLQTGAQAYIALAQVQEQRDVAAQMAHQLVDTRTVAAAPRVIADFLQGKWRQVLEAAWLAGGEDGTAWREARSVVPELLSSVQAKPDAEERKRVAVQIPALLQKIRSGLDRIGVTTEARAPFLDACLALQTAVLRGKELPAEPATVTDSVAAMPQPAAEEVVNVLAMHGLTLKSVRLVPPVSANADDLSDEFAVGDWVEFQMPDGIARRGRLCWISAALGNPLFSNAEWDCAISLARVYLERQLASGRATLVGDHSFFDTAAEKALRRNS